MTYISRFAGADNMLDVAPVARSARWARLASRASSITTWVRDYVEEMANLYAAVTMYEQLQRLSDTELRHRGLTRENLARDVLASHSRTGRSN